MKSRITEIDRLLDDESISDDMFDALENEARLITYEIGVIESKKRIESVKDINPSEWLSSFLSSFGFNPITRTITSKQYEVFRNINNGKPFKYNGLRYDVGKGRNNFGTLIISNL
jgi:hypothetical protein